MIQSTSSSDRTARTDSVPAVAPSPVRNAPVRPDSLSTESASYLQSALDRQPEIRPDVVARASALAADPGYPSVAVMKNVAGQILAAPDLSEDLS
jgi:hypothetical protein